MLSRDLANPVPTGLLLPATITVGQAENEASQAWLGLQARDPGRLRAGMTELLPKMIEVLVDPIRLVRICLSDGPSRQRVFVSKFSSGTKEFDQGGWLSLV